MKNHRALCESIFIILLVISPATVFSKLIVIEDAYNLQSSDFNYPYNNETLDVIWLFSHSIKLHVHEFHLNGHMGDFVLISDQPLVDKEDFKEMNGTDDYYVDRLANSIVTNQGLLLSWVVEEKIIQAVNNKGTFVLFHSEKKDLSGTAQFDGFEIEIVNYDDLVTTTTSTTPDPVVSERPGQSIYISKFLSCKEPMEFFNNTIDFKRRVANLATEFCNEIGIPLEKGDIRSDEVNIPGPNAEPYAGIHYCDTTWAVYATCVEVTFAILRLDSEGNYILPAERLEEMWMKKAYTLSTYGYCPYNPPEPIVDLNTLVWVAFFCGIIISLLLLLGGVWIKNTIILANFKKAAAAAADGKEAEVVDEKPHAKHYDEGNPIYRFVPSAFKPNPTMEDLYPTSDYLEDNTVTHRTPRSASASPKIITSFESVPTQVHAYENRGFEKEENDTMNVVVKEPLLQRNENMLDTDTIVMKRSGDSVSEI